MLTWILCFGGLFASWYWMDLSSDATFQGLICPLLIGLFLIVILVRSILTLGTGSGRGRGDSGHFGGWSGGGHDGGCGGDGGGDAC